MAGIVVTVKYVRDLGLCQGLVIVIDVFRRGVGVLIAEEADHGAAYHLGHVYGCGVALAPGQLDVAAVKHHADFEVRDVAGAQPGDAAAPAVADNAQGIPVHVVPVGQEVEGVGEVRHRPVVAAFLALHLHLGFLGPPVKDKRRRDKVAVFGQALGCLQGEFVVLDTGMAHRDMLGQEDARKRPLALRLEQEHLHGAAVYIDGFNGMGHGLVPPHCHWLCGPD